MINVGDLVKVSDVVYDEPNDTGLVVDVQPSWPGDDRDDTMTITIVHADGTESEWHDFHLQVISEAGWPGA